MASRIETLTGKGKWFNNLFVAESYKGGPARYKLLFGPDQSSLELFKTFKLMNKIKEDADGTWVNLARNHDPRTYNGKILSEGGPPKVVDANGQPWDRQKLIGNMSDVTIKLEVYESQKGAGSRLVAVRIDNLVEYEAPPAPEGEEVPF